MPTLSPESPSSSDSNDSTACCPQCTKPGYSANGWCRFCGYYGVLGTCVDLASWEQDYVDGEFLGEEEETPDVHTWMAAINAVPDWAWYLGGLLCLITVAMVAVRLYTVPGGAYHLLAAAGLLIAGLAVFVGTHLYAGLRNMFEDAEFSLLDVAIHPLQLWCTVCLQLPHSLQRVMLIWGSTWTLILVHAIVGVPYGQFVDFTKREETPSLSVTPGDIASAVASSAAAGGGKDLTLEEALGELDIPTEQGGEAMSDEQLKLKDAIAKVFGGGPDDKADDGLPRGLPRKPLVRTPQEKPQDPDIITESLGAVIIGYTTEPESQAIESIVVAVKAGGKWRLAGSLRGLSAEVVQQLQPQLTALKRESPIVETRLKAQWVEPQIGCQIEVDYSRSAGKYREPRFVELR